MSDSGLGYGKRRLISEIIKKSWGVDDPYSIKYNLNDILYIIQEMGDEEGKKYVENDTGNNRGFNIFKMFVQHLLYRNLANYDSMILLTSEKGCLTDDTLLMMPRDLIKYPNGVPLKELVNKGQIYVYSFNKETKQLELKQSDGVEFVKNADVYEIELISGQKIKTTDDHPFMLMDGSYKQLKDLIWLNKIKEKSGACFNRYRENSIWKYTDRLRMVSVKPDMKDYIKVNYDKIINNRNYKNKQIEYRFILEQLGIDINGKIVHHIDGNHYNNSIDNLKILLQSEHVNEHMTEYYFKQNNTFCKNTGYSTKKKIKIINGSDNFKNMISAQRKKYFSYQTNIDKYKKIMKNNGKFTNMYRYGGIIKNIKHVGRQNVYDVVNVRDNHNFIANGFVVSNTGKSSASIVLAREWCKLLGIRFDPKRHMAYSNRDVMTKIDTLGKFEPIIADESVRFASTMDWSKKESKELRKKIAEVRTKHMLFILNFPLKINKMEKTYLDSFVNYWCITGDVKIITRDKTGMIRNTPVKNLNKYNPEILSYNINTNKYEFKAYDKKIKTKKNAEIFELELENGLKIKCTEDHPFLTQRGWVRLKELTNTYEILSYDNLSITYRSKFIQIKTIKKLKKREDVYDIVGVKDNHNFVANNMVVHNCDLFGRGIGAIYVKDRNPVNDPWRMKDFKNVGAYTEFTKITDVEKRLKKHPNFWKVIKFPKPPQWLYDKYLEVREKNVYDDEVIRDMVTTEDVHRALLLLALQDIMMNDTTLNMNRISLHIKNNYDIPITKNNIQALLLDSKQLITKIREEQVKVS